MLFNSVSYFLNPKKSNIVTIGIDLYQQNVCISLRSSANENGIRIPDWGMFEARFGEIEDYFAFPEENRKLEFIIEDADAFETTHFCGRTRHGKKYIKLQAMQVTRANNLYLCKDSFMQLKLLRKLIACKRIELLPSVQTVKSIFDIMSSAISKHKIVTDAIFDDIFVKQIQNMDVDQIIQENEMNLSQVTILYEILYFRPGALALMHNWKQLIEKHEEDCKCYA